MEKDTLKITIKEIDRFKSVASALTDEGCPGGFIIDILIKHLQIKFANGIS